MDNWTNADLLPYVHHVVGMFGVDRIMFGSDWPVSTQGTTYPGWMLSVRDMLKNLPAEQADYIFGRTAIEFYRL